MFNATSVNEAKKTTQLNHYILVFTVITIFYLPLSFVSVSRPRFSVNDESCVDLAQDTLQSRAFQLGEHEAGVIPICDNKCPRSTRHIFFLWVLDMVHATATQLLECRVEDFG